METNAKIKELTKSEMDATDTIIKILHDIPMSPQLMNHLENALILKKGMRGMTEIGVATAQKIIGIDKGYTAASDAIKDLVFIGFLGPKKTNDKHDVRLFPSA